MNFHDGNWRFAEDLSKAFGIAAETVQASPDQFALALSVALACSTLAKHGGDPRKTITQAEGRKLVLEIFDRATNAAKAVIRKSAEQN